MKRINQNQSVLENPYGIPVSVFANEAVKVEPSAINELQTVLQLQDTIAQISKVDGSFFGDHVPALEHIAVTPDFHKGSGIPIGTTLRTSGFVLPQAIGKDINCGMRLLLTDLTEEQIRGKLPLLKKRIRHVYFEGGRGLPLSPRQKKAMLQYGLQGLLETHMDTAGKDLWQHYDVQQQRAELQHVIDQGSLNAGGIFSGLENYTKIDYLSYDAQLGSIGGGNHFVEVQRVDQIADGALAHAWGIKPGMICVMIHTGSVSIGYPTAVQIKNMLRNIYPTLIRQPENGLFPLPLSERYAATRDDFFMGLKNAANFAFANRLFLGLMMRKIFHEVFGEHDFRLLYDSGHNMLWEESQNRFLHRKGACPARGMEQLQDSPFAWTGEPVLIPGSMGAASYILAGNGYAESNSSASHGAGRSLSRGDALKIDEAAFRKFLEAFHIITPIDPDSSQLRGRQDILQKWHDELKMEAPFAFKPIRPVIDTQLDAGIARLVAEVSPVFTVKG